MNSRNPNATTFAAPAKRSTTASTPPVRSYRRANRVIVQGSVAIYPRRRGTRRIGRQSVKLRDFSATGLGLLSTEMIEPGTRFAVRLVRPDGSKVAVAFEVVYCRPVSSQAFTIGAKLPEGPSEDAELFRKPPRQYQTSLSGTTVSGWERVLDIRAEEDRLWINMHPPDKESGWGMYLDRGAFEQILKAGPEKKAA